MAGLTILPRGHAWAIDGGDADSKVSTVGAISHHGQMLGCGPGCWLGGGEARLVDIGGFWLTLANISLYINNDMSFIFQKIIMQKYFDMGSFGRGLILWISW